MKRKTNLELPKFKHQELLLQALTHTSYLNEHSEEKGDNQRLEFLGDCTLGFLVGAMLYEHFPDLQEGDLTRRRSMLVDEPNLAYLARELGLGNELRIGKGAELDGGRESPSILSDAFEALIGAYFLDSGIDAVNQYVQQIFLPLIKGATEHQSNIDAKSLFQQYVQANFKGVLPEYLTVREIGPDHARTFTVEVHVEGKKHGTGEGRSKKEAEKQAAKSALGSMAKSRLQEWVQKKCKGGLPEYRNVSKSEAVHTQVFEIEVWVEGKCYGMGQGRNKKEAENQAATAASISLGLI
ncbi:MAG: ribonuclease III [Pseudanabaena sp. CRU_2_10]|nr:ribonuclease III [Pseudanabaena sp. CRU_2_10]